MDVPRAVNGLLARMQRAMGRRAAPPPLAATTPCGGLHPLSRKFGFDRGTPIDRYYIATFLQKHARDVSGRVLEVGDREYTRRFGGRRVTTSDVLNPTPGPGTTVVGDLEAGRGLPARRYDVQILTQVLPFIFDTRAVIANCQRLLKPGGVLLATVPGISQISRYDADRWGDFWRFTPAALRRLLAQRFAAGAITIEVYGNVRAASAFLYGLAAEELSPAELDFADEDYPVLIASRSVCVDEDEPQATARP